jgi:formylglycine-generating enzyme required for sulfatase activity
MDYIVACRASERAYAHRRLAVQTLVGMLGFGILTGLLVWMNQDYLKEQWRWYAAIRPYMTTQVRPYVLTADAERALKPKDHFKECANGCPEMVVVPAGQFIMGSSENEKGHEPDESPQHNVSIPKTFAVSMFEVTFDEWDTCVTYGDCDPGLGDSGWGRGRQPVINATWDDAQRYVAWLSRMTGETYRLLTEAEWEYAARAGTQSDYSWGNEIGKGNASCLRCGSRWDNRRTAPVGSFAANAFDLHDMHGNVWEWVEDCIHDSYEGAPEDGSAWTKNGNCEKRVLRGGGWVDDWDALRAANRLGFAPENRDDNDGIRVARTLSQSNASVPVASKEN